MLFTDSKSNTMMRVCYQKVKVYTLYIDDVVYI